MADTNHSKPELSLASLAERAKRLQDFQIDRIICCADGLRGYGQAVIEGHEQSGFGGGVFALGDQVGNLIEDVNELLDDLVALVQRQGMTIEELNHDC